MTTSIGKARQTPSGCLIDEVIPMQKGMERPILFEYMTMLENGFELGSPAEEARMKYWLDKEEKAYQARLKTRKEDKKL